MRSPRTGLVRPHGCGQYEPVVAAWANVYDHAGGDGGRREAAVGEPPESGHLGRTAQRFPLLVAAMYYPAAGVLRSNRARRVAKTGTGPLGG